MKSKKGRRGMISCIECIFLVGILVGAALFHVWQKVEMARVVGGIDAAEVRMAELGKKRTKLMAAIAVKKRPGTIEQVAIGQLGMVHPRANEEDLLAHWKGE